MQKTQKINPARKNPKTHGRRQSTTNRRWLHKPGHQTEKPGQTHGQTDVIQKIRPPKAVAAIRVFD